MSDEARSTTPEAAGAEVAVPEVLRPGVAGTEVAGSGVAGSGVAGSEAALQATFVERFRSTAEARTALCVGIDPSDELLAAWGLPDTVTGLDEFAKRALDGLVGTVGIIKPQMAWFERFASAGVSVLERLIAELRAAGVLVVLDAKRGDIGLTNQGYGQAWLASEAPCQVDALTVHAYLGVGALAPLFDAAAEGGSYLFVVAHSSNPEGRMLQSATDAGERSVGDLVIDEVNADRHRVAGVVIGATLGGAGDAAARLGQGRLILAPGIGAQGADVVTSAARFGDRWADTLPSVSRAVLRAGPDPAGLRAAAERLRQELRTVEGQDLSR